MWGYYGTQYRVRLYPPFGYSILYKEYYLTRFNHQNNNTQMNLGFRLKGVYGDGTVYMVL